VELRDPLLTWVLDEREPRTRSGPAPLGRVERQARGVKIVDYMWGITKRRARRAAPARAGG
jgi:hypothetical protein